MKFNTKSENGKNTFGTQDTTVSLQSGTAKFKFQIKDFEWKTNVSGNLKFEGTDPNSPKARAGKAPEVFSTLLNRFLKILDLCLEMIITDIHQIMRLGIKINHNGKRCLIRLIMQVLKLNVTESDFVEIMDAMYQEENAS